jgi:hypothetical protein
MSFIIVGWHVADLPEDGMSLKSASYLTPTDITIG